MNWTPATPIGSLSATRLLSSLFSYTYELPIFYPLCFDIHASDGGCGGCSKPSDVQTFNDLSLLFSNSSVLFGATAHTQLSCLQSLAHSFRRDGGGRGSHDLLHGSAAELFMPNEKLQPGLSLSREGFFFNGHCSLTTDHSDSI